MFSMNAEATNPIIIRTIENVSEIEIQRVPLYLDRAVTSIPIMLILMLIIMMLVMMI